MKLDFVSDISGEASFENIEITNFGDEFSSNWNEEEVYGRGDPISTFKGTRRTISLGWKVSAKNKAEAIKNVKQTNILAKMLYPEYNDDNIISSSPLVTVELGEILKSVSGYLPSINISPNLEDGYFDEKYPQSISIDTSIVVLRSERITMGTKNFPWGEK